MVMVDRESLRQLNIAQADADDPYSETYDPQWASEMRKVIHQRVGWETLELLKPITEKGNNSSEAQKQLEADHERLTRNYGVIRSQNLLQRRHIEFLQRQLDDIRASQPMKHTDNNKLQDSRTTIPRRKA